MIRSIRNKISLTYILFALVTLISVAVIIEYELESQIEDNIESELLNEIDIISHYLADSNTGSFLHTYESFHQHTVQTQIRITAIDSIGTVLLDSEVEPQLLRFLENHRTRPEINLAAIYGTGRDKRMSKSTSIEYFYVAKKIDIPGLKGDLAGIKYLRASLSLQKMQEQISSMRVKIAYAGIIAMILILILSIFVSERISKPLRNIITKVNEISRGNYNLQIDVTSHDETRMLADSINSLAKQINTDVIELERLAKVRSQFLANVSHELRTPLFSMQAFLETLLKGAINDPAVNTKYLSKALAHVDRLNFLLNDLIEISRIESGELKLSFRYFSIDELFQQISDTFKVLAEQKQITLEIPKNSGIQVYGDRSRLQQVFSNLIDNAIKYNPEGTCIKISCKPIDKSVQFSIEDNGIGIAAEHLPRIFERFYRVDKERSRETGGTGLGLAIVKHIVEAHGSTITATSTAGTGTTFSFCLKK